MNNNYSITGEQMKAIKAVEKALKEAASKGVHFWDNYGNLCAYNHNVINQPVPDPQLGTRLDTHRVYHLKAKNFHAGNADDQLYVEFK